MAACAILFWFFALAMAQQADKQAAEVMGPAVNPAYMDLSVKPGDDFYAYCCGTWEKNTTIPPDRGGVSPATPLQDMLDRKLADLIEEAGAKRGTSTDGSRRVFDLYHSFMNEAAIEVRGREPLAAPLKRSRTSATGNSWRALSAKHSGPTRTHSTIQTSTVLIFLDYGWRRGLRIHHTTRRTCCKVDLRCRTASTTCRSRMR